MVDLPLPLGGDVVCARPLIQLLTARPLVSVWLQLGCSSFNIIAWAAIPEYINHHAIHATFLDLWKNAMISEHKQEGCIHNHYLPIELNCSIYFTKANQGCIITWRGFFLPPILFLCQRIFNHQRLFYHLFIYEFTKNHTTKQRQLSWFFGKSWNKNNYLDIIGIHVLSSSSFCMIVLLYPDISNFT